jgi:hypothetical protein
MVLQSNGCGVKVPPSPWCSRSHVTLLIHSCYTAIILLVPYLYTVVTVLLYCCCTVVTVPPCPWCSGICSRHVASHSRAALGYLASGSSVTIV